jgi:hypothetical protein
LTNRREIHMQQINGHEPPPTAHRDAPFTGPWSVEPIHDALVTAKIQAVRASGPTGHGAPPRDADADTVDDASVARARRRPVHALRVRVGHAFASVGRAIEGPPDCDDTAHGLA